MIRSDVHIARANDRPETIGNDSSSFTQTARIAQYPRIVVANSEWLKGWEAWVKGWRMVFYREIERELCGERLSLRNVTAQAADDVGGDSMEGGASDLGD
jgi:hypothetical protein